MAVNVEQLTSEVVPESEHGEPSTAGELSAGWEEVERLRAARARLIEDQLRTRSEGFDD